MYETHRTGGDSSEVYNANVPANPESHDTFHTDENDWADNDWFGAMDDWDYDPDDETTEVTLEDGTKRLTVARDTIFHKASYPSCIKKEMEIITKEFDTVQKKMNKILRTKYKELLDVVDLETEETVKTKEPEEHN